MDAIRIFGLRYRYPGTDRYVLEVPSLSIESPGLTAITGPSGSGKSTLVELIAGTLREPYSGELEVLGVDMQGLRRDADRQRHLRRIGLVPQDFGLLPTATVGEILRQDLADAGIPRSEHEERIAAALEQVGLAEFLERKSVMLSGGQRQRVAIARMLARDVELVIADEPTANLDPELVSGAVALFRDLAQRRAVVIVTHDMRVAELCDRRIELPTPSAPRPVRGVAQSVPRWGVAAAVVALALLGGTATAVIASSRGNIATPPSAAPSALPATAAAPSVAPTRSEMPATFVPVTLGPIPVETPTQISTNAPAILPSAIPTSPPFGFCGLYVPGKNAQITVEGYGVTDASCTGLIPYLHHNVGDWYLVTPDPTAYPTTDVRCEVSAALLPDGDSGRVTDTGTFSTATGDNACADLRAATQP